MEWRQKQNLEIAIKNPNENWFYEKIADLPGPWHRQVVWMFRIFDFYNPVLKIAVEIDGPEHDRIKDAKMDEVHLDRFGIRVIRVRNRREKDAKAALEIILAADGQPTTKKARKPRKGRNRVYNKEGKRMKLKGGFYQVITPKIRHYVVYIPNMEPRLISGPYKRVSKLLKQHPGSKCQRIKGIDPAGDVAAQIKQKMPALAKCP